MKLMDYSRIPNAATDSLTPYLLFEGGEEMGICPDFLTELVSRFEEDESVKPMITRAVSGISLQLSNMTMNDNYKPHVNVSTGNVFSWQNFRDQSDLLQALKGLCQFKPIATAIAMDPLFQMATSAPG